MEKNKVMPECCKTCKRTPTNGVLRLVTFACYDCKQLKASKTHFCCEICHCITPIECEGSEPNTCADCMPLTNSEN